MASLIHFLNRVRGAAIILTRSSNDLAPDQDSDSPLPPQGTRYSCWNDNIVCTYICSQQQSIVVTQEPRAARQTCEVDRGVEIVNETLTKGVVLRALAT